MSLYRKAKLAIDAFHGVASKILTATADRRAVPAATKAVRAAESISGKKIPSGFFSPSSISPLKPSFTRSKQKYGISARRFYYIDRYQVQHFKRRGPQRWFQNPRTVILVVLVSSGVLITVYYGNLETVPYTNRTHFILLSRSLERQIGEAEFEKLKASCKGKILPALHPVSIRVRLIAKDIVDALQRGVRHEQVWIDPSYASERPEFGDVSLEGSKETIAALRGEEGRLEGQWHREDEILDDKWILQSRKAGKKRGLQPSTQHLEGLNWEVLVVNEPVVNAFCIPGGKIVVFTGLLDHFRTDAELATIISHEVSHAIARHPAEGLTKNMWFAVLQLILLQFISMPDLVSAMSHLLLRLPFSRRMEMEADYIGLLLLASAGYDPRAAPKVYEKLGQVSGDSTLRDYLSTHPSGKTRAKLLAQAQVMEEALAIYRETVAGRGIEGFL
ncbi:mitochondrial metalloendopeptidase OMA1 [Magnolia sinica]|uniref:mitochondrial metalloendopeptidase OMA1 n=1 Tax=Magnolia sinica TaxID=86752 RepID=UPI002659BAA0|nr:mitochondrial metalloendopeptidase OMA1 [Magnolia sinica]